MSAMPTSSRALFFGIVLAIASLAFSARAEDQQMKQSGASSDAPMAMAKSPQPRTIRPIAMRAMRSKPQEEKDLSKAIKHAGDGFEGRWSS